MRLSKKHIGQLFDTVGGDGSWVYELIDIKKGKNLFYSFDGTYYSDPNKMSDWRPFKTQKFPKNWVHFGWCIAKEK